MSTNIPRRDLSAELNTGQILASRYRSIAALLEKNRVHLV
jgi:hypothetical protein